MLNKLEMEDIWKNKGVGYLRFNFCSKRKLKKFVITFSRELIKRKKIDDVTLEVFASSARDAGTLPTVREIRFKASETTKVLMLAEGYDTYSVTSVIREIK